MVLLLSSAELNTSGQGSGCISGGTILAVIHVVDRVSWD